MKYITATARISMVVFVLFTSRIQAQDTKNYADVWISMLNHFNISDKWQLGNELHLRGTNGIIDKEQFLIRPFVTYHSNALVSYTVGYTFINSFPYQKNALNAKRPEHNIWEQVTLKHGKGLWRFSHRLRLEHRFQGRLFDEGNRVIVKDYAFSNRFRYRFTIKRPITQKVFVHLFDELWIRTSDVFQHARYDRNWLYLGVGYQLSGFSNIQLAYLHQNIQLNDGNYERHPTLQLGIQYDFNSKKQRARARR